MIPRNPSPWLLSIVVASLMPLSLGGVLAQGKGPPKAVEPGKVPRELLVKRAESAAKVYKLKMDGFRAGVGGSSVADLAAWSHRLLEAQVALHARDPAPNAQDLVNIFQAHLTRIRDLEAIAQAKLETGRGYAADAEAATYHRIEAEILLLQAGGKLP